MWFLKHYVLLCSSEYQMMDEVQNPGNHKSLHYCLLWRPERIKPEISVFYSSHCFTLLITDCHISWKCLIQNKYI
jgi:hypothetical protein